MTAKHTVSSLYLPWFQYRKRYEVTCDEIEKIAEDPSTIKFQYRKRYEVTCDSSIRNSCCFSVFRFQYRKRYEVTCDEEYIVWEDVSLFVSIPQAV